MGTDIGRARRPIGATVQIPGLGCGALIERNGKILLIKRLKAPEAGHWSFVGGKVDFGETSRAALIREVWEEVGVTVQLGDLVLLVETPHIEGQHWVSPVYHATIIAGEPQNLEPEKIGAVGWFALDALPTPLAQAVLQVLNPQKPGLCPS